MNVAMITLGLYSEAGSFGPRLHLEVKRGRYIVICGFQVKGERIEFGEEGEEEEEKGSIMCIAVFLWRSHPLYPFLLLLNRDEYHSRPTVPLGWWGDGGEILGGRDGQAGGTWLASTRHGKIAFLTNVRGLDSIPDSKSRGQLPLRFLQSNKNPEEFAKELEEEALHYNGFNLILADVCSQSMVYITNRRKSDKCFVTHVSPGMHVLSNASLDTPWGKVQRLGRNFTNMLNEYGEGEPPLKEMVEKLMTNTIKDDENELPHIYPAEREHQLSSIFVAEDTPLGPYGTRSTSALLVRSDGEVKFYERCLDKERWNEQTVIYQIEKMKCKDEFNADLVEK